MTTTPNHRPLSLQRTEDILAYIPHALGFRPERSAVLLLMIGQRLEATLRVDLPGGRDQAEECGWVSQVCELLDRLQDLTAVLAVIYPGDRAEDAGRLPWSSLLERLATELENRGSPLRQAWCHGPGSVWDYLSAQPDHGRMQVGDPQLNTTHLQMVLAGSAPLEEPWDGRGVAEWPNAARIRELAAGLDGDCLDALDAWAALLELDPYRAERLMRSDPLVPARLLHGLDSRMVRDLLPYLAGVGASAAIEAVRELGEDTASEAAGGLSDFLLGRGAAVPRWERIDHLWFLCRDLLGAARGSRRAALLCLMAWIEWAKGRGSMSMALLRGALGTVPDYRLARLLEQLMLRGIMPQWATDPQRAWRARFG